MAETNVKPGYRTTEFWVTLATQAVSILLLTGAISTGQSDALNNAVGQLGPMVDQIIGLVGMVGSQFGYAISRGAAKKSM